MVAVPITVRQKDSGIREVSGEVYRIADATADAGIEAFRFTMPSRDFLTAEDDKLLAKLWDNEDDAAYDDV
jgi:hypothetical protein